MKHKLVKKVLMCEPLYFDTLDYSINPWMQPGTIDKKRTLQEWNELVQAYKDLNIEVEVIKQEEHVPDMVFSADEGIVQGKKVLLSRFWKKERQKETQYYDEWFRNHGYDVHYLPNHISFEGNGDSYFWNDQLLIGIGYRADINTCHALSKIFDREVIPLQIIDPLFYHLDVGLFPLNDETMFYYPPAFSEASQAILQKKVPNLITLTHDEAFGFSANSLATDHHVIVQKGNQTFQDKVHALGYKTVEIDLAEFKKSGGGAHCLTNILEEEY